MRKRTGIRATDRPGLAVLMACAIAATGGGCGFSRLPGDPETSAPHRAVESMVERAREVRENGLWARRPETAAGAIWAIRNNDKLPYYKPPESGKDAGADGTEDPGADASGRPTEEETPAPPAPSESQ